MQHHLLNLKLQKQALNKLYEQRLDVADHHLMTKDQKLVQLDRMKNQIHNKIQEAEKLCQTDLAWITKKESLHQEHEFWSPLPGK